jgi:nicotinate-nucleotide adenylyltransferase
MIRDTAVLEAVRLHTAGAPGMGALAKILYIADKIEVSRHGVDPALRVYAESATLDQLLEAILNSSIRYLRSQKQSVSSETISLLKSLHKNGKRN